MNSELDKLKQYRIGILAGGSSSEREISLKSGDAVLKALKEAGFTVVFLDVTEDSLSDVVAEADLGIAFIALHGRFGEDGTVQRIFEKRGIPYTGSGPESSRLALDKLASKKLFREKGVRMRERDSWEIVRCAWLCVEKHSLTMAHWARDRRCIQSVPHTTNRLSKRGNRSPAATM